MSKYPKAGFLKEFVKRTKDNLIIIDRLAKEEPEKAFEVTQLLNSTFGLLLLPEAKYFNILQNESLNEKKITKFTSKIKGDYIISELTYCDIIRHLRNAVAHPHRIVFQNEDDKITGFVFVDVCSKPRKKRFEWALTIEEFKTIIFELCDVLIKQLENNK